MKFLTLKTALILKFFFACSLLADSTKTQPLESKLWTGDEIGQNGFSLKPDKTFYYKLVNKLGQATQLKIHAFFPKDHKPENKTPAILFFHGGGWYGGTPDQFYPQCRYFAMRGMVTFSAEYRCIKTYKTSPQECVKDGKSAMRWLRKNASNLGIGPNKLAAGGGSAGGHIASATAFSKGFEEADDDKATTCIPNALVLYNPVFDNGPKGFAHDLVKKYWKNFSPIDNITKDAPPSIVILGTKDIYIPVATAKRCEQIMHKLGRRCDLHIYQDKEHGFFNIWVNRHDLVETMLRVDEFLCSLNYLQGPALLKAMK
jgi:acetyl esterase